MDGKDTFMNIQMEDMYYPVVNKVEKLAKKMTMQFKEYKIRNFTIEKKKVNLFSYMKNLAFKKYRKIHLVKIIRKQYINIFSKKELNKLRRTKSHRLPYHQKTYHIIIYRNLYNYKYRPYVMPLTKEDKANQYIFNLTDINRKRKKIKKRVFVNPHLELKIKTLTKIKEKLDEKVKVKKLKINKRSSPSLENNNVLLYNKLLVNNWNNQRKRIQGRLPKLRSEKSNFYLSDNLQSCNSNNEEKTTNYKSYILRSIDKKKGRKAILPKIGQECSTTIKTLNQINHKLKIFKGGNAKNKNDDKINHNNLLNLNLPQLYKLFYIKNKKKNKLTSLKKKENIKEKEEPKTNSSQKKSINSNKIIEEKIKHIENNINNNSKVAIK